MRLKSLRLSGFKSFADKTEFQFPDGITCIVGPNGCGKSNVVDALKWVLGEQRPTALRGSEMADVIFGGTAARKPLGMAEVSLLLDNSSRSLALDFEEIEVTRRLFRDGTSEYLLNRSPCRLRDLRELLMDTGSGPGAMSFMEQGRIDQILRESVDERRAVFEEAAGISKYKARRKEALRKLERVEGDLLRVTDVVAEKERTVRSLKIQAGRAERYQALVDEMKGKRLVLALHRYSTLLDERSAASSRVSELSGAEEAARAQVREAFQACRNGEEELESRRSLIVRREQEVASLQTTADTAREKGAFAARLASELDGKIRWYVGEIETAASRLLELTEARERVDGERSAADAERASREARLAEAESAVDAARRDTHERRAAAAKLAEKAFENLGRQSRLASQRSRCEAESRSLEDRSARLAARAESIAVESADAARRLETAEIAGVESAARLEDSAAGVAAGDARIAELEARVRKEREALSALDRESSAARSRADVLRVLETRMEGVAEGTKRFLEAARKNDPALPRIRGMLADLLTTAADRASAVESALGACASAVVVETLEDAERCVAYVRERKLGRCVFLPLDAASPVAAVPGALSAAVTCSDDLRAAVDALLGESVAVTSIDEARTARRGGGAARVRAILADGTVIEPSGAVAGGGAAGGSGILQRKSELRDVQSKLDELVRRLDDARTECAATEAALADARRAAAAAREALRAAESAAIRAKSESDRARNDMQRLAGERGRIDKESADVTAEFSRAAGELAGLAAEIAQCAADQKEAEARRTEASRLQDEAEQVLRATEDRRMEARVGLASVSERCASLAARATAVQREIGDLDASTVEARRELAACEKRKLESEERCREAQKAMEQAQRQREVLVQDLAVLRHEASQAHTSLEKRRALLEEFETAASKVTHELNRFRMQENEARLRVENLLERIRDELGMDLEAERARRAESPAPEAEGAPVYATGPAPTLAELESLESEVLEIKGRIERMGAVNLEALSQLTEAEREAQSLRAQLEDLTKSRESLLQAVRKIDQESRAMFEATFHTVRANFQEMFRKLFGGGKADVFLTEGQDILEAGIEIVAKPPGKEQRSISLLSGGERTMTAVALLFAIYLAKPSPFCLMDEVDAALDETNIDRFVNVLTGFAEQSQFVIVSHNKRTVAASSTIVGVSMPEPGVSRKLAVRLDDLTDDGEIRASAAVSA